MLFPRKPGTVFLLKCKFSLSSTLLLPPAVHSSTWPYFLYIFAFLPRTSLSHTILLFFLFFPRQGARNFFLIPPESKEAGIKKFPVPVSEVLLRPPISVLLLSFEREGFLLPTCDRFPNHEKYILKPSHLPLPLCFCSKNYQARFPTLCKSFSGPEYCTSER